MTPDWNALNRARVKVGPFGSVPEQGFNGFFEFMINGLPIFCIASDGHGWQHVSVSIPGSTFPPSWYQMCRVKELFWGPDEWVMQLHPPKAENINNYPGCLHLWRPTAGAIPVPSPELVGLKGVEYGDISPAKAGKIFLEANTPK